MLREADIHPCFACTLDECDDKAPACALRRAHDAYQNANKHKRPVTPVMREQYNIAYRELYSAQRNERRRVRMEARV
jgi:hypothetical protein